VANALTTQSITSPHHQAINQQRGLELASIKLDTIFIFVEINKTGTKPKQ
jgi:hypothetical protein